MTKKDKDPFGFNKAINWDKLEDPKVLKELEKIFIEEDKPKNDLPDNINGRPYKGRLQ